MAYDKKIKNLVSTLRKKGDSIGTIAHKTGLAKSTVSLWVRKIVLPKSIRLTLEQAQLSGREKGRAASKARRTFEQRTREVAAKKDVNRILKSASANFWRLTTALLYWCEGEKTNFSTLRFTNSDPELIVSFLKAMRSGFELDERKFRVLMHLHSYHNEKTQKLFWSQLTNIPQGQFNKSFHKPHSGLQIHPDYEGCISIRYHDAKVAKTIAAIYHAFANETKGE
ncbi:MAG: hypothetical protein WC813_01200 [Patescibacteria group bacterium]|jgi:hypothetical protein